MTTVKRLGMLIAALITIGAVMELGQLSPGDSQSCLKGASRGRASSHSGQRRRSGTAVGAAQLAGTRPRVSCCGPERKSAVRRPD